jgi:uncharacterized protein YndB with AHSA1/START domain
MASFTLTKTVDAPPEAVFDVITDHRGYSDITPVRRVDLEREGEPAPNGVGAIRVLHAAGPPMREEITVYERPTRFAYKILSGAPVRDHLGQVTLEPIAGGTLVTYRIDATPAVPVVGRAFVGLLKAAVIPALLRGVKREAERRAGAAATA